MISNDDAQHRAWMRDIAEGGAKKDRSFNLLYRSCRGRLKFTLLGKFRRFDTGTIDDRVQEAFITVYLDASSFKGESTVFSWICSIGLNKVLDWIRLKKNNPDLTVPLPDPGETEGDPTTSANPLVPRPRTPQDELNDRDTQASFDSAFHEFAKLYERCARIFRLYFFEELATKEVAAVEGVSDDAIRRQMTDCRRRWKALFPDTRDLLDP